jgi:uncharacterized protein (DUF433 family)
MLGVRAWAKTASVVVSHRFQRPVVREFRVAGWVVLAVAHAPGERDDRLAARLGVSPATVRDARAELERRS